MNSDSENTSRPPARILSTDPASLAEAARILSAGGLVAVPTETVYGLAADATNITINDTGQVYAQINGQVNPQLLGQISLASFVNEVGLAPLGGNLYRETAASGVATVGAPGENGLGQVKQGYLESSNVDAVKEITELISAQRAYEMNSKVIQAADEMLSVISKGMR